MPTRQTQRYRQLIDRFEQVARVNLTTCANVADLCRLAGINERTLSRAFSSVHGIGTYRYVRALRLNEVRRALASEDITVTQAAMRFGFRELGRFGVLYREVFGESPSDTRRRIRAAHTGSELQAPTLVPLVQAGDPLEAYVERLRARADKVPK
jgi:transcriptional regulator GlxA family with amidase domain